MEDLNCYICKKDFKKKFFYSWFCWNFCSKNCAIEAARISENIIPRKYFEDNREIWLKLNPYSLKVRKIEITYDLKTKKFQKKIVDEF